MVGVPACLPEGPPGGAAGGALPACFPAPSTLPLASSYQPPSGPPCAELAELDLSWNHVGRLPVALKRAPQLRRLSLHGNNPLDAKDVEGVLARMPSLEWLDLSNTGTPEAMIRALHARLPRLAIQLSSRRSYP